MNLDSLDQDALDAMSYEELAALAQGGEPAPAPEPETPLADVPEAVTPEAIPQPAPEPATPEAPPQQAERRGDPEVPLRAVREENRALQERLAAYEAALQDPERVRQHLASLSPADFDDDPQGAVEQMVAPLMAKIQQLEARDQQREAQLAHHQMMSEMGSKHGPEFHSMLQAFDADNPHLADLHPEVRYYAAQGLRAKQAQAPDPKADEARIQAAAEKLLADKLASGKPMRGIPTLGSAPQVREDRPAPDLDKLSQAEMDGMSFEQLRAMALKAGGG